MPSKLCATQVQSPLATAIHLLVTLFVAASYIPQLIEIARDKKGTFGISGWYIILLTTSATAHFATRIKDIYSSQTWSCFRHGELKGFDLFSALVIYLQPFVHWLGAMVLLVFYVSFREQSRTQQPPPGNTGDNDESSTPSPSPSPSPRNAIVLAIVLTHAAILLPLAIRLLNLITREDADEDIVLFAVNALYGILFRFTGIVTSLTAAIPQIHLMLTTHYRATGADSLKGGGGSSSGSSLSLLSLALQVSAFLALGASQGWRMRVLPPGPDDHLSWARDVGLWSWEWWANFFFLAGLAAGWVALAICQAAVLGVALGVGRGQEQVEGRIRL